MNKQSQHAHSSGVALPPHGPRTLDVSDNQCVGVPPYNNHRFSPTTLIFLVTILPFIVLTYTDLIVYNEELLILLSFGIFIAISFHYMKDDARVFFQEAQNTIRKELQQSFIIKKKDLQNMKENALVKASTKHMIMLSMPTIIHTLQTKSHALEENEIKATYVKTIALMQHVKNIQNIPSNTCQTFSANAFKANSENFNVHATQNNINEFTTNALQKAQNIFNKKKIQRKITRMQTQKKIK